MAPLLKWPGGKRLIVPSIGPLLPLSYGRYYEPFLGGGALFFHLRPTKSILSDTNAELINLYKTVRDTPEELVAILKAYKNSKKFYYRLRSQTPRTSIRRAARLLYLTTLSFNGIHRVNLKGQFNVPYGWKKHLSPYDRDRVYQACSALHATELRVADFENAVQDAQANDLVYFDPPYTVAHKNNGFVKYNERIFSWDDQVRLAAVARRLASSGCHVFVSNADHESIRALYGGFKAAVVERFSRIAASSEYRRPITETIFYWPQQNGTAFCSTDVL